jgi:hypothetical protein
MCCPELLVWAGLDNAILGFLNADERKVDGARIAQLLAHGAHALNAPDEDTLKEGEAFASEVCPLHLLTSHCIASPTLAGPISASQLQILAQTEGLLKADNNDLSAAEDPVHAELLQNCMAFTCLVQSLASGSPKNL